MKKITHYAHLFINEKITSHSLAIDFTLGNGHDASALLKHTSQLYAFDIQQQAIKNSIINYPALNNAILICDSHENIGQYVTSFDIGIFNLGYLPNGDKTITTTATTTINTLKKALPLLNKNGRIVIVVYTGHPNGKIESEAILDYLTTIKTIKVAKFKLLNRPLAPYILIIDK